MYVRMYVCMGKLISFRHIRGMFLLVVYMNGIKRKMKLAEMQGNKT
jgi:hypothetical protein